MKILLAAFLMLVAVSAPLIVIYQRFKKGKRGKAPLIVNFCAFFGIMFFMSIYCFSQSALAADAAGGLVTANGFQNGMAYLSAALAVGLSGIGGGIAVASSASAALGALSEDEGIFGKALIFVGMAEGVALYGLLIAFMIIMAL